MVRCSDRLQVSNVIIIYNFLVIINYDVLLIEVNNDNIVIQSNKYYNCVRSPTIRITECFPSLLENVTQLRGN